MGSSSSDEELVPIMHFKKKNRRFWVHLFQHRRDRQREFHLIEELKLYHGRFRMNFRMLVGRFVWLNNSVLRDKDNEPS